MEIQGRDLNFYFGTPDDCIRDSKGNTKNRNSVFIEIAETEAQYDLAGAKATAALIQDPYQAVLIKDPYCKNRALLEIAKLENQHDLAKAKKTAALIKENL